MREVLWDRMGTIESEAIIISNDTESHGDIDDGDDSIDIENRIEK